MTLIEKVTLYEKLMRLDKPIGILLLLWPTLWGLWLGHEAKKATERNLKSIKELTSHFEQELRSLALPQRNVTRHRRRKEAR